MDFIYQPPTEPWLTVVHEDRDIVVLDKQAGLLTIPGRVHTDSVLSRVIGERGQAYAVHRLDMDTSGLLVIALRRKAEREIQRQFRERLVEKHYIAVVWGQLAEDEGEIDLPLRRVPGQPPRSVVDHTEGKTALTRYRVLERTAEATRVELSPQTGRSHQLRVHLHALGHPIVGDRFYGSVPTGPGDRLHLHAHRLALLHPFSGEALQLDAPTPF